KGSGLNYLLISLISVLGRMIEGTGVLIGLGVLALWELLAAIGCFALSKGVLHNSDMPVLRTGK
ncbi:MAG: hypothetical protein NC238_16380, partial [Dehalobacter sp.]|nr:hypothetical protein [Dehalobacter sp.]